MHKRFYSIQWFLKESKHSILLKVKMTANCAKIDRVGSLDAVFQQVALVQNF